jgi:uridine kinase
MIIGIDGRDGMGKSSLANWLGWQLGIPAYSLDDYFYASPQPHAWRTEELIRITNARLVNGRPVIVEGIFLLEALAAIEANPGYLIFVENEHGGASKGWQQQLEAYFEAFRPRSRANFVVSWSSEEYEALQDARELQRILGDN